MAMATVNHRYSKDQIEAFYAEGLWRDYSMFDAL
ncbi:MAG: hypothetical protein JWN52_3251, partial [Actinomycetia bacterium]|nr:hypothetical protein [Actinomycetes bacterium]